MSNPSNTSSQLNIFLHDCDSFCVNGTEISKLKNKFIRHTHLQTSAQGRIQRLLVGRAGHATAISLAGLCIRTRREACRMSLHGPKVKN